TFIVKDFAYQSTPGTGILAGEMPAASTCPDPSGLTVNSLTENTADITWTAGGTETEWEIEYGITGFTPGTGTPIADNDGVLGETLTGLTANNAHEADVESIYSLVDERGLVDSESYTSLPLVVGGHSIE